ncbi:MAG TPA: 50S ribosomal protein L6 [Bacteroidales bacterium]|nr:50S ribosomal protein L6 [Bacteroidales bacterium]
MSRIGKMPITIPDGVEVKISDDNVVSVKGKLGELQQQVHKDLKFKLEDGTLTIERPSESLEHKSQHGLVRSLVNNMVTGVSEGYTIVQELVGVGYKANATGQVIEFSLGYSHSIFLELPAEVQVETVAERGKNPTITLKSHDKQLIGQVAAKIRSLRKPEPYKGKGILFKGEQIRRKAGKAASE